MKVLLVSEADLSKPVGKTMKITALASELANNGIDVILMVPDFGSIEPGVATSPNLELHLVRSKGKMGTLTAMVSRCWGLIKETKNRLRKEHNTLLQIEGTVLGGYFALAGFSDYVLNADGLSFAEALYGGLPWFVPPKLYSRYLKWLERLSARRASKVIAISQTLKDYFTKNFGVPEAKIEVVRNGYFESKISRLEPVEEIEGMVSFIGLLARWAKVDKVIRAADALKNERATFYIVGDGPSRSELEKIAESHNLSNVVFTGYVPIDEAYKIIAQSEVVLSPMDDSLSKTISCPIKQIEYMALGKAMVIDGVGEISALLKNNNAALVCNPHDENEFVEGIRRLIHDKELRRNISSQASRLSQDFTWGKQGKKLVEILNKVSEIQK